MSADAEKLKMSDSSVWVRLKEDGSEASLDGDFTLDDVRKILAEMERLKSALPAP